MPHRRKPSRARSQRRRLYLESLETRRLLAVVASDGFESGDLSGGSGDWVEGWQQLNGTSSVTTSGSPQSGSRHALVQGGRDLSRSVDIRGLTDIQLSFGAKISSFESSDRAYVQTRIDGGAWTTLKEFRENEGEDVYRSYSFDITGEGDTLELLFDGQMSSTRWDRWYIDDVQVSGSATATAEFIPLGVLPGQSNSAVSAISPDGRYVVGNSDGEAYRWSLAEGMISLGTFIADDVSADGLVVVGGDGVANAYRWEDGTLTSIGDLSTIGRTEDDPGGARTSSAHGISADGQVIVGNTAIDFKGEADSFRIIGSGILPIGDLPGGAHNSGARAVSADGSVVVGRGESTNGNEAYRWENGAFTPLGDLPGGAFESRAWTVSGNGQFVVGQSESEEGLEAFKWSSEQGMVGLGHLAGETTDSRARGVSGDGATVVGIANHGQSSELRDAFIWDDANGMRSLQDVLIGQYGLRDVLAGWTLNSAKAISDDGLIIAGTATNADGGREGYIVDLAPSSNQPPAVDAGEDVTVADDDGSDEETVTLNGSGVDPDGTIVGYEWSEGGVVLGTEAELVDSFAVGVHTLTLTVTDNEGATASDTVVVTVNANVAPEANGGADKSASDDDGSGGEVVTLNGSGSDLDGSVVGYEWKNGATVLGTTASISPTLPVGTHTLIFTVTDNGGATASDAVTVTVNANIAPEADAGEDKTVSDVDGDGSEAVTLVGSGTDSDGFVAGYEWKIGSTVIGTEATLTTSFDVGLHNLTFTVIDNGGLESSDLVTVVVTEPASGPKLSHGVAKDVGSAWQTITLPYTYDSMVVIATPNYDVNSAPAVVRIQNATSGNSFQMRVDAAGETAVGEMDVHYVVVEEGIYDTADYKIEAVKFNSTVTDENNSWAGESRAYQQSYSAPVVVGQVMTYNDADWSVFWASGSSRTSAPTTEALKVGKHVGEDSDTTRASETIGYLVIETSTSGEAEIEGLPYVAAVGADTIRGVDNDPFYSYTYNEMPNSKAAVASIAGMDGGDGGWAILYGDDPITPTGNTIKLAIDEDQWANLERKHTTEQVAYFIIDPPLPDAMEANDGAATFRTVGRDIRAVAEWEPRLRIAERQVTRQGVAPRSDVLDWLTNETIKRNRHQSTVDQAIADLMEGDASVLTDDLLEAVLSGDGDRNE